MKHGDNRVLDKHDLNHQSLVFVQHDTLLPYIAADEKVVLFDAVCKLCTGWTKFLIRYDQQALFKLCNVQSVQGQAILQALGLPTDHFDTMLFIEGQRVYQKSDAFLRVMQQLPIPWRQVFYTHKIPKELRDWAYDRVAQNRYALFGKHASCVLPTQAVKARFLDHEVL